MAVFDLSINKKLGSKYISSSIIIQRDNCNTLEEEIPIGVSYTTPSTTIQYLIQDYIGVNWKNLKINTVQYSNETNFYLEYNGLKINSGSYETPITIPVLGVNIDDVISTFIIKILNLVSPNNETITFNLAVENTDNEIGDYITITIQLNIEECVITIPTEVFNVITEEVTNCFSYTGIQINVPAGSTRWVEIRVTDLINPPTTSNVSEEINISITYPLNILGTIGIAFVSTIVLTVKLYEDGPTVGEYTLTRNHTGSSC